MIGPLTFEDFKNRMEDGLVGEWQGLSQEDRRVYEGRLGNRVVEAFQQAGMNDGVFLDDVCKMWQGLGDRLARISFEEAMQSIILERIRRGEPI